jgi:hypothetical protein
MNWKGLGRTRSCPNRDPDVFKAGLGKTTRNIGQDGSVLAGIRTEHLPDINVRFSPVQRMQLLFCRAWTNMTVTLCKIEEILKSIVTCMCDYRRGLDW